MGDRSKDTDTGFRGRDGREGFGDDMGTRVGRPDGAAAGQPSTNRDAVADGLEGSIMDDDAGQARGAQERRSEDDGIHGSGPEQARVQDSARQGDDVNRPAGDNRRVDDL